MQHPVPLPRSETPPGACAQCGHAAHVEPAAASVLLSRLLGVQLTQARCPVVWDDGDSGLPPEPCGCRNLSHAA